ncbi:MAG: acyl-CoA dehydrogenase family protein, partial [Acidimicrobiia bacterium]
MMEASERALLEQTVRDAFGNAAPEADLDTVLGDLGWLEMLDAEPRDAIGIVFTALGATNGTATVLDDVLASALGTKPNADVAVLLPPFGTWESPGRIEREQITAAGLTTARAATAKELLVVCRGNAGLCVVAVPADAAEVSTVRGIDPDAGCRSVRVHHDTATVSTLDADAWDAALALGRRALGYQISGASRTMLDLARIHAVERVQFDRPIARFQAVRHRLADALVAIEALDATLAAAADEP